MIPYAPLNRNELVHLARVISDPEYLARELPFYRILTLLPHYPYGLIVVPNRHLSKYSPPPAPLDEGSLRVNPELILYTTHSSDPEILLATDLALNQIKPAMRRDW